MKNEIEMKSTVKNSSSPSSSSSVATPQNKKQQDNYFNTDENGATMNPLFKANLDYLAEYGINVTPETCFPS